MNNPETPAEWHDFELGNTLSFENMRELMAFEDTLHERVDPFASWTMWMRRTKLVDLVRPPKYNGTIADISLTAMKNAGQALASAKDQGIPLNGSVTEHDIEIAYTSTTLGFVFNAFAKSTVPELRGPISAGLWYVKRASTLNQQKPIRRITTKPLYDKGKTDAAQLMSRLMGYASECNNIKNAYVSHYRR